MDRRTFLAIVTGTSLATPLITQAQPTAKVYRIGYLAMSPNASSKKAFLQGLLYLLKVV